MDSQQEAGPQSRESESEVAQSCPTLCNPMDCSPPGSSVPGILQARVLGWVAIPFSRGSSPPRDWTQVSHKVGGLCCLSRQGSPPQSCSPKEAGSADHLSELGIMSPPLTSVGASSWKQPHCHLDHALLRLSRGPRSATPAFLTHRNGHFSGTKLVVVATQQLKTNALTTTQKENK